MRSKTMMTLLASMLLLMLLLLNDCRVEGTSTMRRRLASRTDSDSTRTSIGRGFSMLPLRARHVYRLLHATGQEDALPEGRVITQGLAAVAGFTLGLTKALGAVFIYDIITANVTDLEGADGGGGGGAADAAATIAATAPKVEEMCFNTRSARSLEEAEAIAEYYTEAAEISGEGRAFNSRGRGKQRRWNKQDKLAADDNTALATGTAGDIDTEEATGTFSSTYTDTDDGAINCVAIEKRRRRRSHPEWV